MPRALVTGAAGFVGPYLIQYLLKQGYEVSGGVRNPGASLPPGCKQVRMDVTDPGEVRSVIAEVQPDEVYHLAGITRPANGDVDKYYGVNFGGALNLLQAVCDRAPKARVLLVGSAYSYGKVDHPVAETAPLEPVNHYGVSKAAADLLGRSYALQGMHVVRVRPFNHSGPGQSPDFVLPAVVQQFVEIKAGKREPVIRLGNLESVRDFSDVRDVVLAYHLALKRGRSGEAYNVGSGRGVSVLELFELVRAEARLKVELVTEPSRVRATDIPYLVADTGRVNAELGWQAGTSLQRMVRDMLGDVRLI